MALPVRRSDTAPAGRWDPLREFEDLSSRLSRLFEQAVDALPGGGSWSPAVDIEETDDAYLVEADLPGVQREDVTVELTAGELAIHGELKERERAGVLRRRTRRTGRFDYRVSLPADADADQVSASLKDGVLTVRVAKTATAAKRRIEITAG